MVMANIYLFYITTKQYGQTLYGIVCREHSICATRITRPHYNIKKVHYHGIVLCKSSQQEECDDCGGHSLKGSQWSLLVVKIEVASRDSFFDSYLDTVPKLNHQQQQCTRVGLTGLKLERHS